MTNKKKKGKNIVIKGTLRSETIPTVIKAKITPNGKITKFEVVQKGTEESRIFCGF